MEAIQNRVAGASVPEGRESTPPARIFLIA
jgi:hypothetical protein